MDPLLLRLVVAGAIIAAAGIFGVWWRRRDGAVRRATGSFELSRLRRLGLEPDGARALGLLLTSPTCTPCRQVKEVLGEVGAERDGFRWAAVDAAEHLDLAERHHVMRVPTLFMLDADGRILARTSGVPGRRDLHRVLDREGDLAREGARS